MLNKLESKKFLDYVVRDWATAEKIKVQELLGLCCLRGVTNAEQI